jgi:hypothetical protein
MAATRKHDRRTRCSIRQTLQHARAEQPGRMCGVRVSACAAATAVCSCHACIAAGTHFARVVRSTHCQNSVV